MNLKQIVLFLPASCLIMAATTVAENADLPEMPSLDRQTQGRESTTLPVLPQADAPVIQSMPTQPRRSISTEEEREALRREREWLVEAMKEKEAERSERRAEAQRPANIFGPSSSEDMSQSIIDMVIRRNDPTRMDPSPLTNAPTDRMQSSRASQQSSFNPAISGSAMESWSPSTSRSTTPQTTPDGRLATDELPSPILDTVPRNTPGESPIARTVPSNQTGAPGGVPAAEAPQTTGSMTVQTMTLMEQERNRMEQARPTVRQVRSRIPDPLEVSRY